MTEGVVWLSARFTACNPNASRNNFFRFFLQFRRFTRCIDIGRTGTDTAVCTTRHFHCFLFFAHGRSLWGHEVFVMTTGEWTFSKIWQTTLRIIITLTNKIRIGVRIWVRENHNPFRLRPSSRWWKLYFRRFKTIKPLVPTLKSYQPSFAEDGLNGIERWKTNLIDYLTTNSFSWNFLPNRMNTIKISSGIVIIILN